MGGGGGGGGERRNVLHDVIPASHLLQQKSMIIGWDTGQNLTQTKYRKSEEKIQYDHDKVLASQETQNETGYHGISRKCSRIDTEISDTLQLEVIIRSSLCTANCW